MARDCETMNDTAPRKDRRSWGTLARNRLHSNGIKGGIVSRVAQEVGGLFAGAWCVGS